MVKDLKGEKLLVIAPHPDDEVIGCGGLIKKIKDEGGKVYVLFLTVGDTRDFSKKGLSSGKERIAEIEAVARFLKYDGYDLAFDGNEFHLRLDTLGQKRLMDAIERDSKVSIQKIKPSMIAFPWRASYNQDHRIAAAAAHACTRPAPSGHKHLLETVLAYEEPADQWQVGGALDVNFFVKLTHAQVDAKIKALKLYKSQFRKAPSLRSVETLRALATLRGSACGAEAAEGFVAYRMTSG